MFDLLASAMFNVRIRMTQQFWRETFSLNSDFFFNGINYLENHFFVRRMNGLFDFDFDAVSCAKKLINSE